MQDIFTLDKLYKISRKRIVDNDCIALEIVYIPVDYCGHINTPDCKFLFLLNFSLCFFQAFRSRGYKNR